MKKPMYTAIIAFVAMSSVAATAAPEEEGAVLRAIKWSEVPLPVGGALQNKPGESPTLLVKHEGSKVLQLPLWELTTPGITKKHYALRGRLRYKDVAGIGYLELWNEFPSEKPDGPKPRYFSRALAETGPFSRITGSSDWREVLIPFDASQSPQLPEALELNLILPGAGEVEITSLVLVEFEDAQAMGEALVSDAALPPSFQRSGKVAWAAAAVAMVGMVVWLVARNKGRQLAEVRRMKAMDAMP